MTNDNISAIADQTYTGEAITPVIEVKDGDKVLELGTDYTVAYENNENASEEAKVKVTVINKNYQGSLEKTFVILPKTINPAIDLTAPVKNAVPQTTVETNEYTAEITWSPDVDGKFAARTAYTATITVTPKANYTVKGIQENGFAVEGAKSVTNAADSGVVTAGYAATAGSGGGTSRYTVLFETNGGSKVEAQRVEVNATVTEPAAPTKDGFDFAGWYTDQELTKKYDFSAKVTQNFSLYAAWNKKADDNPANNRIILTIGEKDALVFGVIKTNDVAPIIVNDRTMLPARFVAENLGAKVSWDESKQLVTVVGKNDKQEDVTILLTIGSDVAQINGADVKLDSPAFVQNDRTYTPLRFIAENLGATVDWVESEQKVIITKQ